MHHRMKTGLDGEFFDFKGFHRVGVLVIVEIDDDGWHEVLYRKTIKPKGATQHDTDLNLKSTRILELNGRSITAMVSHMMKLLKK